MGAPGRARYGLMWQRCTGQAPAMRAHASEREASPPAARMAAHSIGGPSGASPVHGCLLDPSWRPVPTQATAATGPTAPAEVTRRGWTRPCHNWAGAGLAPATTGLGPDSTRSQLGWGRAHRCHNWAGTGLTPATSATGRDSPRLICAAAGPVRATYFRGPRGGRSSLPAIGAAVAPSTQAT